jgi:hypothetical protein
MQRVSASSVTLTQALASLHTLSINGTGADFTQLHHLVKYFPVLTGLWFFFLIFFNVHSLHRDYPSPYFPFSFF